MKQLEDNAEANGTSKLELMERAGKGIASIIEKKYGKDKTILFVCYHGNNGGDGFTAARYLLENDLDVEVYFCGDEGKLRQEAKVNYDILFEKYQEAFVSDGEFERELKDADIIVDCILGISAKGDLRDPIKSIIEKINIAKENNNDKIIVAIDVPTGTNPDTGEKSNVYIQLDLIITMHDIKEGLKDYSDKTEIVDIGL
ncbi:NAD(P)H-hydrate epimerase [Nanoarchaeota archaeon]